MHVYSANFPEFGIVHAETWSLPIAARKGNFSLRPEAVRDLVEEWRRLSQATGKLNRSFLFRLGRELRLFRRQSGV